MDGVQKANSGYPGTAMAMAPVTYCRFVLSIGHASREGGKPSAAGNQA